MYSGKSCKLSTVLNHLNHPGFQWEKSPTVFVLSVSDLMSSDTLGDEGSMASAAELSREAAHSSLLPWCCCSDTGMC